MKKYLTPSVQLVTWNDLDVIRTSTPQVDDYGDNIDRIGFDQLI